MGASLTRDEKIAEAKRLRAKGLTRRAIAERLGYAHGSSITRLLRDPEYQRELNRRTESRPERAAAKRAWEREHDRRPCPCGAPRGAGAHRVNADGLCAECRAEVNAVGTAMTYERIAALWARGLKLREIADARGTTPNTIVNYMARMRAAGWDLPYRNDRSPEGLERARNARRAA